MLKTIHIPKSENSYNFVKSILLKEGWIINANNDKNIIQAFIRKKSKYDQLLTIVLTENGVQCNVIKHPYNKSLIKITRNTEGEKMISELNQPAHNSGYQL